MSDKEAGERLSKRLARQLPCSRREAELYIAGGWVSVDGRVVEEPQFKVSDQRIELLPGATPREIPPTTLLLNRPAQPQADEEQDLAAGILVPVRRLANQPAGQVLLKAHFRGLVPLLPLAPGEEGLLVFTQDRGVARRLGERGSRLEEEWQVEVIGSLDEAGLEALRSGAALPGQLPGPARVSWQSETRLRFAIKGRASGLLEPLCRAVGLTVVATRRLRLGGVSLGAVPPGEWRYLKPTERF